MPKIILCRGIQGSGKTTWAKQWALEDPEHRVRFNNDDIRNMLGKYWVPSREDLVKSLRSVFLLNSMSYGFDIVIPLQKCIERDSKRPDPIGEEVIRKTYEKYKDILKV